MLLVHAAGAGAALPPTAFAGGHGMACHALDTDSEAVLMPDSPLQCAPSRNSFMSGRRPYATKALSFIGTFRQSDIGMNWATLPEWFKLNGYNVAGSGKLFHPGVPANYDQVTATAYCVLPILPIEYHTYAV